MESKDNPQVCESGERNAAYIVKSANAYPRLVAVLKEALPEIAAGRKGEHVAGRIRALLRELGEAS